MLAVRLSSFRASFTNTYAFISQNWGTHGAHLFMELAFSKEIPLRCRAISSGRAKMRAMSFYGKRWILQRLAWKRFSILWYDLLLNRHLHSTSIMELVPIRPASRTNTSTRLWQSTIWTETPQSTLQASRDMTREFTNVRSHLCRNFSIRARFRKLKFYVSRRNYSLDTKHKYLTY